jgi:hypothetical protein
MRRKYLGVLLPVITVGCLLSTPMLVNNSGLLLVTRLVGVIAGTATLLRKTDDDISWFAEEQARLNEQRDELSKRYIADTEILEGWVSDESLRLAKEANERILSIEQEAESLVGQAMSEAELWQSKYLEVLQQLEGYLLPKRPKGVSRVEVVSCRIIDFYYGHGFIIDYEDSWTENEFDLVRVKPRTGGREPLAKLSDELQIELKLAVAPSFSISQGCIQIRLETTAIDTRVQTGKPTVTEPKTGFLADIMSSISSFRVNGESGSGKSTFVRYLISLMDGEQKLIDPKYPMSEWDISPSYKGIEEAFDGLSEAAELVETRLKQARDDKDNGRAIRKFKPMTFIIDEIDWVVTHYGQEAANQLRVTLKVGRALNVRILYIGQTPLASRLKMNRDDFRHSASFFLGENIPAAIEEVVQSSSLKSELMSQYVLRQQQGLRFSMLVKVPGSQPYLASLPDISVVTGQSLKTELEVTTSKTTELEVTGRNDAVTQTLQPDITDPRVQQALTALTSGTVKSDIIKDIWHFKGRSYSQGLLLWNDLGLPSA